MKVLVTGGAGFIGSHLVEELLQRGHQVCVLDNMSSGKQGNLAGLSVDLVVGDIRDWDVVRQAVAGCDLIFHQAALVSVPQSLADPCLNHEVNVTGAFHVFEAARQAGVKRVVYASSAAVYGDTPSLPARESDPPKPITPYAAAKLINEQMAAVYNQSYGMECIGLRYFNVYGPRQDPSSPYSGVLSIFCQAAVADEGVTIYGDGEQTRDFVYVGDVVEANLLALAVSWNYVKSAVYNIGSGQASSLLQVAYRLGQCSEKPLSMTHQPARAGDIRHSFAAVAAAAEQIGFQAQKSLADGLQATLRFWIDN